MFLVRKTLFQTQKQWRQIQPVTPNSGAKYSSWRQIVAPNTARGAKYSPWRQIQLVSRFEIYKENFELLQVPIFFVNPPLGVSNFPLQRSKSQSLKYKRSSTSGTVNFLSIGFSEKTLQQLYLWTHIRPYRKVK